MNGQTTPAELRKFPLLTTLSETELLEIAACCERKTAARHTLIYLTDEPCDYLCLLVSGTVKIGLYAPDGKEIIKNIQHSCTIFGELGLTGDQYRTEFAAAMGRDVQYLQIKVQDFKLLMEQNLSLYQFFLHYLGDRLRRAERQWESLILKDVRSRIISFLKDSAGERGRQVGFETLIKHGLTQQDIANLVGASRQTVTAILNDLRKSNLIHFNRNTILIRDMDKLN